MDAEMMYEELLSLDPYEKVALEYFNLTGKMLSYTHLIYLSKYIHEPDPLSALMTASAISEQQELSKLFHNNYHDQGLSEEVFFNAQNDIEMKTLRRYFHIPTHKHTFIELVYVVSGNCTHSIGDFHTTHSAGDFVIVPPGVFHELVPVADCVCITTQMRKSTFLSSFSDFLQGNSMMSAYFSQVLNLPYYHCALSLHSNDDPFIRHTILSAYEQQEKGLSYSDSIIKSLWQVLFCYLLVIPAR